MSNIVKNIFVGIAAAVTALLIILTLMGNVIFSVQSGSMEPAIQTGAAVVVNTKTSFEDIQLGDVVCFKAPNGKSVIHRAIKINNEGIETKGDANDSSDGISTTKDNYIGKVVFNIPVIGYVMSAIAQPKVRIIIITAAAALIIISIFISMNKKKQGVV